MTEDVRFVSMGEELVAGTLRGYRQWVVPMFQPRLRCMGWPSISWDTAETTARCVRVAGYNMQSLRVVYDGEHAEDHGPVPDPVCTCGIYGWYRPEDTDWNSGSMDWPYVRFLGAIDVRGKVLQGTRGFRAQHARILGFYAPAHDPAYEAARVDGEYRASAYLSDQSTWAPTGTWRGAPGPRTSTLPSYDAILGWVRDKFKLPVFHTLEELCRAFPPDDLSTLVPDLPMSRYHPDAPPYDPTPPPPWEPSGFQWLTTTPTTTPSQYWSSPQVQRTYSPAPYMTNEAIKKLLRGE